MGRETAIVKRVQVALAKLGSRIFRNNVGRFEDKHGQWITFGLCPGSSDLIGWHTVTVTPEMVGRKVAVFVAVEVKTDKGRFEEGQKDFLGVVVQSGGIAFVAQSEDEAIKKLRGSIG